MPRTTVRRASRSALRARRGHGDAHPRGARCRHRYARRARGRSRDGAARSATSTGQRESRTSSGSRRCSGSGRPNCAKELRGGRGTRRAAALLLPDPGDLDEDVAALDRQVVAAEERRARSSLSSSCPAPGRARPSPSLSICRHTWPFSRTKRALPRGVCANSSTVRRNFVELAGRGFRRRLAEFLRSWSRVAAGRENPNQSSSSSRGAGGAPVPRARSFARGTAASKHLSRSAASAMSAQLGRSRPARRAPARRALAPRRRATRSESEVNPHRGRGASRRPGYLTSGMALAMS